MQQTEETERSWPSANAVVLEHYAAIRRFLGRRLYLRSSDAEDLTQEVCARFLSAYRGQVLEHPRRYLFAIATHVLADFFARARREVPVDPECVEELLGIEASDHAIEHVAIEDDLERFLKQLPRTHRAVLVAHKIEGYSYAEAAKRLRLSELTVEKYLTQARFHLRSCRLAGELRFKKVVPQCST